MANEYASVEEIKLSVGIREDSLDDLIAIQAEAAARDIDAYCGRRFWVNTSNETRYFTAIDPCSARVMDIVTIATVTTQPAGDGNFSDTWTTSDYLLEPYNAAADNEPYERIGVNLVTGAFRFPMWPRGIRIVGKFGWPAVPPAVHQAALIYASRLYQRRSAALGVVDVGGDNPSLRIARTDPDVARLLIPFMKSSQLQSSRLG